MKFLKWLVSKLRHDVITVNGKPYLTRYYLFKERPIRFANIFIHCFHSSDQEQELHNHPWAWGLSFILSGGYSEERTYDGAIGTRNFSPGRFNVIRANYFHRVDLRKDASGQEIPAWTIFVAGPRTQDWGFLDRDSWHFRDWRTNPEAIA